MSNKKFNYQQVALIACAFSLCIFYIFQWMQMISNPSLRTSLDFLSYYSAGHIAHEKDVASVYDISSIYEIQGQVVPFDISQEQSLPYLHMPYLIPLLSLIMGKDYVLSFVIWVLILIAIYAIGFFFLTKWFPMEHGREKLRSFMFGAVTFFPCFVSLLLGQDTAIVFLGFVLLGYGISADRKWLAAVGIALATIRPHLLILIILPMFIFHREVFWKFFVLGAGLAIFSFLLLGVQGMKNFFSMLSLAASGDGYGLNVDSMINVHGFLSRNFTFLSDELIRWFVWGMYVVSIPIIYWLVMRVKKIDLTVLAQMILICVSVAPHIHYHDLALLLLPLLTVNLKTEIDPIFQWAQRIFHPMIVSILFILGLFRVTLFPSIVIFCLFVILFYKPNQPQLVTTETKIHE